MNQCWMASHENACVNRKVRDRGNKQMPSIKVKLVIRNLPFDYSELSLHKLLLKHAISADSLLQFIPGKMRYSQWT